MKLGKQNLPTRLRWLREYYGYSQKQISEFLEISQPYYSMIEKGTRPIKSVEKMEKLANLYCCSLGFLIGKENEFHPLM